MDENISFKIFHKDKLIEITYKKASKQFNEQTVESLIKEVILSFSPNVSKFSPKNYILYCPCGESIDPKINLSKLECKQIYKDFDNNKLKDDKYLLIEKKAQENVEQYNYSKDEIDELCNIVIKNKKKKRYAKKKREKDYNIPNEIIKNIEKYYTKYKRGLKIISNGFPLFYDEKAYKELCEMGIDKDKVKIALRYKQNDKDMAALLSTEEFINWNNMMNLSFDNEDILKEEKFFDICIEEIKKEYPMIEEKEEIKDILANIFEKIEEKKVKEEKEKKEKENLKNYICFYSDEEEEEDE
jgi:flagellar hook-associated protein FlgK